MNIIIQKRIRMEKMMKDKTGKMLLAGIKINFSKMQSSQMIVSKVKLSRRS